ncbi:MAG: peptide-methionine (S)-S-oxide reductase MsrA [Boseongicola sp.]|nr:peptide-methionine (S)-S-oxide reductase MsrA [Boseongicola sp.]
MSTPIPRTFLSLALVLSGLVLLGTHAVAEEKKAYFAGGCFWCVESDFESLAGVHEVVSGYTGGTTANPTYKAVTKGGTGHYEAVEISYDDGVIDYDRLLHHFFRSVDPTDAGGQFCDRGDSYRTAVFVSNPEERAAAEMAKEEAQRDLGRTIVTPILDASRFYVAEDYHQDYYKSKDLVLTRRGPKSKANAYKFYRKACRRDDRVRQLWGDAAPFAS